MNQTQLRKIAQLSIYLKKRASDLLASAVIIDKYLSERVGDLVLIRDEWICDHCHNVHARGISGPLNVPQPVDGLLKCGRCGESTTVDKSDELLEMIQKHWADEESKKGDR